MMMLVHINAHYQHNIIGQSQFLDCIKINLQNIFSHRFRSIDESNRIESDVQQINIYLMLYTMQFHIFYKNWVWNAFASGIQWTMKKNQLKKINTSTRNKTWTNCRVRKRKRIKWKKWEHMLAHIHYHVMSHLVNNFLLLLLLMLSWLKLLLVRWCIWFVKCASIYFVFGQNFECCILS